MTDVDNLLHDDEVPVAAFVTTVSKHDVFECSHHAGTHSDTNLSVRKRPSVRTARLVLDASTTWMPLLFHALLKMHPCVYMVCQRPYSIDPYQETKRSLAQGPAM